MKTKYFVPSAASFENNGYYFQTFLLTQHKRNVNIYIAISLIACSWLPSNIDSLQSNTHSSISVLLPETNKEKEYWLPI